MAPPVHGEDWYWSVNAPVDLIWLPNSDHLIPHVRPAEVVLAIENAAEHAGIKSADKKQ
jgi:hypothetical protein